MALAPRQPGSAIKPFVYLAAFESAQRRQTAIAWTPGTLLADIEEPFPDGANAPYVPTNYDEEEHGMVTVRTALANSYNIPAVRALRGGRVAGAPRSGRARGHHDAHAPGLRTQPGARGGRGAAVELTGAYAVLANGGSANAPVAIRQITDGAGETLCELGTTAPCQWARTRSRGSRRWTASMRS